MATNSISLVLHIFVSSVAEEINHELSFYLRLKFCLFHVSNIQTLTVIFLKY